MPLPIKITDVHARFLEKPLPSPEIIEAAKKWFVEAKPQFTAGATNFAGVNKKGEVLPFLLQGCHASGPYLSHNRFSEVFATEIALGRNSFSTAKELMLPFLRWLVYESYYSPFILNKDDFDFIQEYGIIISGETPYKLLHNLCITSRHFRECSDNAFIYFNRMTQEEGYDPYIPYLLSFCSNISSQAATWNPKIEEQLFQIYGGHRAFGPANITFEHLKRYYEDKAFSTFVGEPWKESATIYGSSDIFGNGQSLDLLRKNDNEFNQLILQHRAGGKVVEYKPPNPFVRKTQGAPNPDRILVSEIIPVLLPYLVEKGYIPKNVK